MYAVSTYSRRRHRFLTPKRPENHNLEEQAQALYKSWFVDFEPFKDGKFVDSELGMIPAGWKVIHFLDIAKLCGGGTPRTDIAAFWGGPIPFFTPKDVKASPFCLKTEKTITENGLKHCNSQLYDVYTTFITARGTVGKLCMAGAGFYGASGGLRPYINRRKASYVWPESSQIAGKPGHSHT